MAHSMQKKLAKKKAVPSSVGGGETSKHKAYAFLVPY